MNRREFLLGALTMPIAASRYALSWKIARLATLLSTTAIGAYATPRLMMVSAAVRPDCSGGGGGS
jgi:hypothetical protein